MECAKLPILLSDNRLQLTVRSAVYAQCDLPIMGLALALYRLHQHLLDVDFRMESRPLSLSRALRGRISPRTHFGSVTARLEQSRKTGFANPAEGFHLVAWLQYFSHFA